ncbi:MAG TPA: TIGR03557 family F420-dependent LLM class oxidoreductase [Terriglobales bacterium]|nr:TIGR03557 family F420-dependent LLM class oxidoreductase [Terriglobales bacterium]
MFDPRKGLNFDPPSRARRGMLKSSAMLLGASMFAGESMELMARSGNSVASDERQNGNGSLRRGMIGFMLAHEQFTVPQLLDFGVTAEQAGFDLLAGSDHFQPWQANEGHSGEVWVTYGALGQRTHRIWMGTTVTCPTFRYNPAVVAEAFATLSHLSPGRIFLGVGSGEALNEQAATGMWPKWSERSERLIEATGIIRQLWTGQPVDHQGKYYRVNAKLYDPPAQPIPLLMAANGPKAMRRAGQYGDGLVTDPKTWKEHKAEFEAGAKAAGKDPAQMPVLVEQYAVVGDQQEVQRAAELWRFGPKAFTEYYNVRDPQQIQQRADAEVPLEKVYGEWAAGTDPAAHIKKVNELFQSGATIVNIHSGQADQKRIIEFYGKEVIPHLNRA